MSASSSALRDHVPDSTSALAPANERTGHAHPFKPPARHEVLPDQAEAHEVQPAVPGKEHFGWALLAAVNYQPVGVAVALVMVHAADDRKTVVNRTAEASEGDAISQVLNPEAILTNRVRQSVCRRAA